MQFFREVFLFRNKTCQNQRREENTASLIVELLFRIPFLTFFLGIMVEVGEVDKSHLRTMRVRGVTGVRRATEEERYAIIVN